jgi:hypothetical protein
MASSSASGAITTSVKILTISRAAEGRHRVALQRPLVGLLEVRAQGDAAGVGVLDDRHRGAGGRIELGHQLHRRVGVVDVVVAQLLALDLLGGGDAGARAGEDIEGGGLMRVLAIAHGLLELAGDGLAPRPRLPRLAGEPGGDGRVIGRGAGVGAGGEPPAQVQRRRAMRLQRRQHLGHVLRPGADRYIAMVLGRRADHRRPADVDVLDAGLEARATGHRRLERIEVHVQQVDRADAVLAHGRRVAGRVAHPQEAAVHHRVQGLHPAVHHLRKAGEVGDILHRQAGGGDGRAGAAGGDQFYAQFGQRLGGLDQAGLVGHGDQGAADGNQVRRRREGRRGHGNLFQKGAQACGFMRRPALPGGAPPFASHADGRLIGRCGLRWKGRIDGRPPPPDPSPACGGKRRVVRSTRRRWGCESN